ncbi:hypothetical protein AB836_02155 [Rickettsiales bacterium (ex Bugula neritina AB1)]|nr:hypothetical protein AB836_02155 [Rickettsiales bacterium (ex Bugula neritina AB1)]
MNVKANHINKGQIIEYNNRLLKITDIYSITPGRRKAIVQITSYDIENGGKIEIRTGVDETLKVVYVSRNPYSYSYCDMNFFYFTSLESFEEVIIKKQKLTDQEQLLLVPQMEVVILIDDNNNVLTIELPLKWSYTVKEAGVYNKNASVTNDKKIVTVENDQKGFELRVPGYINDGDSIIINTERMEFVERNKKK